jgi:hypothetical protein
MKIEKKYWLNIIILFFLFIVLPQLIFNNNRIEKSNNENIKKNELALALKHKKSRKHILNKKLTTIDKIVENFEINNNQLLFFFNGFDCPKCINIGFELIKELDSIKLNIDTYVIGSNTNFSHIQLTNNYFKTIYEDRNDLIRKELKFTLTPVILVLENQKIIDCYYPTVLNIIEERRDFIKRLIAKVNTNNLSSDIDNG